MNPKKAVWVRAFFLAIALALWPGHWGSWGSAWAGGSLGYNELREAWPEERILFETLESALEFSSEAFAAVRIMSGLNQTLAGRRVGPYYVCARRKFGSRDYVRVIFDTRAEFIGPGGQKSEFPEEDSREIRETLMGVRILAAKSPEYFPYDCPAGKQGLVTE